MQGILGTLITTPTDLRVNSGCGPSASSNEISLSVPGGDSKTTGLKITEAPLRGSKAQPAVCRDELYVHSSGRSINPTQEE